ncbi:MAG: sensor histidine kinase [Marmoricola sp.]
MALVGPGRRLGPVSWRTRTVLVTALVLLLVVLLGAVASILLLRRDLTQEYEQRALAIARSVAQRPRLATLVTTTRPRRTGPVEREAEAVRRATGALYVVVTDDAGIRFSHPNPTRIGKPVSTSPEAALAGEEEVSVESGTLGPSARGKVPLRNAAGRVVGEVSVGIDTAAIARRTHQLGALLGLVTLVPLAVGVLGALVLGRRLRRGTLGLEPEQMADLLREHEAVLHGVRDAVVAVDRAGRLTVANAQATALLGGTVRRGAGLAEAGVSPAVVSLMEEEPAPSGALRFVGETAVLATRLPVRREGRDLGRVLILRDRSDLDQLGRELEATRALTDALRAQAHEHSNRLHALSGLLHHDHVEEALGYLDELSGSATWVAGLDDPYLAGLLAAKSSAAGEAGVQLEVSPETHVVGTLAGPLDVITVVANLLDNAVRAAATGHRHPARVEVTLVSDGDDLLVHVLDSGDGVAPHTAAQVFDHGFSSRPDPSGHGLGLALARHTARADGGDVVLVDPGGPAPDARHGAVFEARLSGALAHPAEED